MQSLFRLAAVAAASLSFAAFGQAPAGDFSPDAFRAHVTFLGDDLLEGREAGSRGYDIAARYVASQFAALGLRPAGANASWYQPIQFVRFPVDPATSLTVGGRRLQQGREIVFRPSLNPAAMSVEAPLVFVRYGLDMPARGFNDYAGVDVRGRIVVVLSGTPSGTPSDVAAHLNAEKRRMAAARGAVGMITVRTPADAARVPWQRLAASSRPATTWIGADGRLFTEGDGLAFSATIDPATAETLFAGAECTAEQVLDAEAREGGCPRGFALAQTARVERAAVRETRFTSANVLGLIPGSDSALADQPMLLMAHLDGLGIRTPRPDDAAGADQIRNGAMDNATGVATLIEVARQLMRDSDRPRRPILLAAVTAEEIGLLGAEYLAHNPVGGRVAAVVNLDMPVLTYPFSDVIAFGAEHSTLGPIVRRAAARMNVALAADPLPQEGLFTRSDHYKFVREGVPSVFLMTGFAGEGRERFTRFLADTYHSPRDDLSLPFDWQAGARFAQLNYLIAREIADAREVPRWYADSFFGDAVAAGQPRAQRAH
ncbi:M28 family metallopeptidase [Sphingosinicella sp.]|uniref:M28 family metallopeptidase n=1 Tax=Sphingosinicella sp. TaxID=1917971 RepID=UPI004037783B